MVFNKTEEEERQYLGVVLSRLRKRLLDLEDRISSSRSDVLDAKKFIWENKLDQAEQAFNRENVSLKIDFGEKEIAQHSKVQKLLKSPYFGRVDFVENGQTETENIYIGVHSFVEENNLNNLIYDWRAPVSSVFYDFGMGKADYSTPVGKVEGEIHLKRQYSIKAGVMEHMIESSLNINDEILLKELSSTSDEKMKNIVTSIQKEQNAVIRNETSKEVIIQGVEDPGKPLSFTQN